MAVIMESRKPRNQNVQKFQADKIDVSKKKFEKNEERI